MTFNNIKRTLDSVVYDPRFGDNALLNNLIRQVKINLNNIEWVLDSADYDSGFGDTVFTTNTIGNFIFDNIVTLRKVFSIKDSDSLTPDELNSLRSKIDTTEWVNDAASQDEFGSYCFDDKDLNEFVLDNVVLLQKVLTN